jgi:hypothetical protein
MTHTRKELAMTRFRLAALPFVAALLLPAVAAAKGPSSASISGPGLEKTIVIQGNGESFRSPLGQLTMEAGFFPGMFQTSPDPMLKAAPKGNLGPKFRIDWVVPVPDGVASHVSQDLYPYAHGGAVTYTKPGQSIFDGKSYGGWYVGGRPLKLTLVKQGLRASASASGRSMALVAGIAVPGGLALIAAGIFGTGYRKRRQEA